MKPLLPSPGAVSTAANNEEGFTSKTDGAHDGATVVDDLAGDEVVAGTAATGNPEAAANNGDSGNESRPDPMERSPSTPTTTTSKQEEDGLQPSPNIAPTTPPRPNSSDQLGVDTGRAGQAAVAGRGQLCSLWRPVVHLAVYAMSSPPHRSPGAQPHRPATFSRLYAPLVLICAVLMLQLDLHGALPSEYDDMSSTIPAYCNNLYETTSSINQTHLYECTPATTSPPGASYDRTSHDSTATSPRPRRGLVIFADAKTIPILTYSNGDVYKGEFKDGTYTYTYTYADGESYTGQWKDGKRHGQGTYTIASGAVYKGEFSDGKKHGQGTYTYADGESYTGQWKDGKPHGQGTTTYTNGDVYKGEFSDGKKHGQGKVFDPQGIIIQEGEWKDGKPPAILLLMSRLTNVQLGLTLVYYSLIIVTVLLWEYGAQFFQKSYDNDGTCVICQDAFTNPVRLHPCGHHFCNDCILPWIARQVADGAPLRCPMCNQLIIGAPLARRTPPRTLAVCFAVIAGFFFSLRCVMNPDPSRALFAGWILKLGYKTTKLVCSEDEVKIGILGLSLFIAWTHVLATLVADIQPSDLLLWGLTLPLETVPWRYLPQGQTRNCWIRTSSVVFLASMAKGNVTIGSVVLSCLECAIECATFVLVLLEMN